MRKIKRYFIPIIVVLTTFISSYFLIQNSEIELLTIFDTLSLFTYFGVLIGFAITIYTFGLSMIAEIKKNIDKISGLTDSDKKTMFRNLRNGFSQIKQDIWLIHFLSNHDL
mgnify:CR=1 FL=1